MTFHQHTGTWIKFANSLEANQVENAWTLNCSSVYFAFLWKYEERSIVEYIYAKIDWFLNISMWNRPYIQIHQGLTQLNWKTLCRVDKNTSKIMTFYFVYCSTKSESWKSYFLKVADDGGLLYIKLKAFMYYQHLPFLSLRWVTKLIMTEEVKDNLNIVCLI